MAVMTMQLRMWCFIASFLITGLPIIGLAVERDLILPALVWFGGFAVAHLFLFRCPECKASSARTLSGWGTPFVGDHCRHCGKEY